MILLFPSLIKFKSQQDKENFAPRYDLSPALPIHSVGRLANAHPPDCTCSTANAASTSPTVSPNGPG
jgi:hypothetical protein